MRWASWTTFVLGLWLIVSPFALRHAGFTPQAALNDVVVGIVIAALSLWMAALWQPPVLVSWITALLGIWTVITGIVFRYNGTPLATADEIAVGIAVFILALVRAVGLGRKILESRE